MWAVSLFKREEVLFREAERFDLNLWIRHILRDKEPTPRAAEGGHVLLPDDGPPVRFDRAVPGGDGERDEGTERRPGDAPAADDVHGDGGAPRRRSS